MDDETVNICTGIFLVGGVALIGLNGCNRQHPPSKAVKEPPQVLDIAVVGMARSAIDKAKGVETMLGEAGNRIAETSKEWPPHARDLEFLDTADEFLTAGYDSIGVIEELYL